jgi:hypothetical protein
MCNIMLPKSLYNHQHTGYVEQKQDQVQFFGNHYK